MQRQNTNDRPVSRRALFARIINTMTSLITGMVAISVGTYLVGSPKEKENADEWADAGDIADLRVNLPQEIRFERNRVDGWKVRRENASAWLVLDNHNKITAFSPLCTHLGCAYRWETQARVFVCPCHGSKFALDGKVLAGPAGRPLDRLTVKMEANRLWLGSTEPPANPS
jgi:menaquinol-cytochrome c reductase iron-sulfur subunit